MLFDNIAEVVANLGLNVCESVDIPPRPEILVDAPKEIMDGPSGRVLSSLNSGGQVWKHQAEALSQLCSGHNTVVSTGTASGKSLIFQLYAIHRLRNEPNSRVLAFYPLRALANDQFNGWRRIANSVGMYEAVGRIDGSVPISERAQILERCRIVLMTPDVCQAWMMRTISSPEVSSFVRSLALLVLDEAHAYESVFGSNAAFLLRRLVAAKRQLSPRGSSAPRLQVIAATATIDNPAGHLNNLTGLDFGVIDEGENGAPRSARRILHVEGPDLGRDAEDTIAQLLGAVCGMPERRRFIAFADSRQGVERIVRDLGREDVKPYRSGYEATDRATIERALQDGTLHGVVSTSALELGIDIADMDIGVTLGVPQSRKSFRQRLGRVGRKNPGGFLVLAPANAFTKFGESFSQYYAGSVEPSYLYLGNRFVQFAHARCLREETESLTQNPGDAPRGVNWPEGFPDILKTAQAGFPREFDSMAQIGGDAPHFNYPLRQLGETNVEIHQGSGGFEREIGSMAYHQAIREAYPGATYLHMGSAYKVHQWNHGFNKLAVRVSVANSPAPTRPILRKSVTIDLTQEGIIPGRVQRSSYGLLAEAQVQVNESVEGYSIGNTQYHYRDLRTSNPNMRRKQRDFRTTGVVLKIEDDWFSASHIRREIADGLRDLLARERSIAPQDIDSAHTNIALVTDAGLRRPITDVVVIYDSVYGGLRLTENLFDEFTKYIERLRLSGGLSNGNGIVESETAERLGEWAQGLSASDGVVQPLTPSIEPPTDGNWIQIFKPGSLVGIFSRGEILERELVEPRYIDDPFNPGNLVLYYGYQDPSNPRGSSFTPAEVVQAFGHDWEWIWWNPDTGEYRELESTE